MFFAAKMDTAQSTSKGEFVGYIEQSEGVRLASIDSKATQGFLAPIGALLASLNMPVGMSLVNGGRDLGDVDDRHFEAARFFDEPLIEPRAAQRQRRDLQVGVARENEKVDSGVVAANAVGQNLSL